MKKYNNTINYIIDFLAEYYKYIEENFKYFDIYSISS